MSNTKACFILIFCLCFCKLTVCAQLISEKLLEEKVAWKNAALPSSMLYITTDKTLYLPTEVIWFSGYLLPYTQKSDTLVADMLSVALVNENGTIVMRKTYAIDQLFCAGSLTLTDSIPPGNYQFIAATNLVNDQKQPVQHFRTPIIIRSASMPTSFSTQFNHQVENNTDTLFVNAVIHGADGKPIMSRRANKKNGQIDYGMAGQPVKTVHFDEFGAAKLVIPKTAISGSTGVLQTATTFEGKTKHFNLHSPLLTDSRINLQFYPEGGDLVEDLVSSVPFEALFSDGRPAEVKAELLDNGVIRDIISTDSTGMGLFTIVPKRNHVYSLRIINSTPNTNQQLFKLPQALEKGMVLSLQQTVVNEKLSVSIQSSVDTNAYFAITHMLSNDSQLSQIVKIGKSKKIQIPLNNIAKGLHTLTILDSEGRPFAESLFFAHFNIQNSASIAIDDKALGTNQKVDVDILFQDSDRNPIGGLFTASVVRQSRLLGASKTNIETYYHLNHSLPNIKLVNLYKDKRYLEQVIRIQGWRRLSWQQLMKTSQPDLNRILYQKIGLEGQVRLADGGTEIKGPFTVMPIAGSLPVIFTTDTSGRFIPTPRALANIEGSSNLSFRTFGEKEDKKLYVTELKDPLDSLINPVDFQFPAASYDFKTNGLSQSSEEQLKGEPFVRQLQTVEVKGRRAALQVAGYGVNECGDYVCMHNYVNCPTHSPQNSITHIPIIGQKYSYAPSTKAPTTIIIYQGCQPDNMRGVYTAREFYGMDQLKKKNPEENFYLSTLYWNPRIEATADSKNFLSFTTSDAPGIYKITIEGIADNGDFIYAEKFINIE